MQDFPSNSRAAKANAEPRAKVERVTSAETVRRKRGLGRQFKETFIGGDARTAAETVLFTVIFPTLKDLMYHAFDSGVRSWIYGDTTRPQRSASTGYSNLGRVAYDRMSQPSTKPGESRMLSRRSRARHDFDDIVIQSRTEANEVLDRMFDFLSRYGRVSVADLYELTGIQSSHTDMKWGWTELRGAKALPVRSGGFLLDLPEPEALS